MCILSPEAFAAPVLKHFDYIHSTRLISYKKYYIYGEKLYNYNLKKMTQLFKGLSDVLEDEFRRL